MDLNAKIAARREERARLEQQAVAERAAEQTRAKVEEALQRESVAAALVHDINAGVEAEARRNGETVDLVHVPDPAVLSPDLKPKALKCLFHREARKLWTPLDQWMIISLVAGGICLIHLAGFGLLLILAGLIRRRAVDKRCRRQLREDYPDLFGAIPER